LDSISIWFRYAFRVIAKDNLRKIGVCFALALGTALLYAPALHFDFVNYDDPIYVIDNLHIRSLSRQSLGWCFQAGYGSLWHPLTWMSHMLDFELYGLHPGGHHATSVLLHILNSTLLFVVLDRMTKAFWPSAMVAALFAWHPLHVESVAWISERKDVLSVFFWMLTLWAYVRYVEEWKAQSGRRRIFYWLALFFFALGLMAKPMLVTLPFVLLLLDWWPLGRMRMFSPNLNPNPNLTPQNSRGSTESRPTELETGRGSTESRPTVFRPAVSGLLVEKIPFLVLSILACGMTLKAAGRMVEPLAQFPFLPRAINALLTYFRYVEKMVWPADLVAVYPLEFRWSGAEVLTAGLFFIVVSITAVRLWKARPFWVTGWLWYLGILVPVIGLVQVGAQPMADHCTYLPAIGIFMVICWEAWDIGSGRRQGRVILGTMAALALGACFVLSRKQLEYWRNPVALFSHNLKVTPNNYAVHADYAAFLLNASQLQLARAECVKSIQIEPNYGWSHHVLGSISLLEGQLDEADAELRKALRLDPARADVHLDLGKVALRRNLPVEAAAQFSAMLELEHSNPQAHVGLGQALAIQGRLDDARAQYAEALRLAPQFAEAHHQLAVVLALQHNIAEAVLEYRTALAINPDRPETLNNLAWILATDPRAEIRRGAEAVQFALAACKLTRNQDPLMLGTLAAAYAESGNFDQANATAQQAHDLAAAQRKTDLAARNLKLLEIYRAHRPYHE
jgi:Tfp pilus assembly protein PilF